MGEFVVKSMLSSLLDMSRESEASLYQQQEINWNKSFETSQGPRFGIGSYYYKTSGSHQIFGACI